MILQRTHRICALLIGLFFVLCAVPARVLAKRGRSDPPPARTADAELELGITALRAQNFAEAQVHLESAYLLEQRPLFLYHMGSLAQTDNRPVDAEDYFRRFVSDPNVEPTSPEYAIAQKALLQPSSLTGELTVQGTPLGVLRVDGRLVGTLPLSHPVTLKPGAHEVTLSVGKRIAKASVSVQEDRPAQIQFGIDSDYVLISHPFVVVLDAKSANPKMSNLLRDQMEKAVHRAGLASRSLAVVVSKQPQLADYLASLGTEKEHPITGKVDYVLRVEYGAASLCTLRAVMYAPDVLFPAAGEQVDVDCRSEDVSLSLGPLLDRLLGKALSRQRDTMQIDPKPSDAAIRLRDLDLGTGPRTLVLWHDSYQVSARLAGYDTVQRTFEMNGNAPKVLPIVLTKTAPAVAKVDPPTVTKRPLWKIGIGSALLVGGVVLVSVGGYALAIDGRCVMEPVAPVVECPQLVDSRPAGIAMLSVGGGLLLGGGLAFAIPSSRSKHLEPAAK
jgi:hypothetical protein